MTQSINNPSDNIFPFILTHTLYSITYPFYLQIALPSVHMLAVYQNATICKMNTYKLN